MNLPNFKTKDLKIILALLLVGIIGGIYYLSTDVQKLDIYARGIAIFIICLVSYILGRMHSNFISRSSSKNEDNLNFGEREEKLVEPVSAGSSYNN